jgi:acyl-CoA-binding protein
MNPSKAQFDAAAQSVQRLPVRPGNATLLKLYALYKQATAGDVSGDRPGMMNFAGRAKYDAWAKIKGMTRDTAMREYVELAQSLAVSQQGDAAQRGATTGATWQASGIYFEACNCDSACPCYSGEAPTYGYCEGNCAWHIERGRFGETPLDGLTVVMIQRCDGHMITTPWKCWLYVDDRATAAQFTALQRIFSGSAGGHLERFFANLWQVQAVERARIEFQADRRNPAARIPGRIGVAIGQRKPELGEATCPINPVPGVLALAAENSSTVPSIQFDHAGKNALVSTFAYQEP